MKTKQELFTWAEETFSEQLGLDLNEILTLNCNRFTISSDNALGLSMASLTLNLPSDEHGDMGDFLQMVGDDNHL